MLQQSLRGYSELRMISQSLGEDVDAVNAEHRDQLVKSHRGLLGKLNVEAAMLEQFEDLLRWRPEDDVNLVQLVELAVAWEKRGERENLVEATSERPNVHLRSVVSRGQQAFRCAVPASRDVSRARVRNVGGTNGPQICQLNQFRAPVIVAARACADQDVLGLDVTVEDAAAMQMVQAQHQLIQEALALVLRQRLLAVLDVVVH